MFVHITGESPVGRRNMESNAAGLVLRPALKTGFSEMGWGSTPLLSAKLWSEWNNGVLAGCNPVVLRYR